MATSVDKDQGIKEIEELIAMASDVSGHIKTIEEKIFKIRIHQLVSFLFIYLSVGAIAYIIVSYEMRHLLNEIAKFGLIFAFIVICLICSLNLFIRSQERNRLRDDIETETRVLNKLMEMIFSIKEDLNQLDIGVIQYAIIEMKLNRIKFSPREKKLEKIV